MPIIKESSDELNPAVVQAGAVRAPQRRRRTATDALALALATCGVGYLPLAPGTWGSAVGVALYLIFQLATLRVYALMQGRGWDAATLYLLRTNLLLVIISGITLAGIWAATRAETLMGRKDPGAVVIDEVAGQLIAYTFVPAVTSIWITLAGFILFRLFDIWKPYPVRRMETLESGLGIMGDDVLAGIYAALVLSLLWLASTFTGSHA
jgi:phosphatidylglycerophosphatase A